MSSATSSCAQFSHSQRLVGSKIARATLVALFALLNFGDSYDNIAVAAFLLFVAIGAPLFITSGISMKTFEENHPELPNFYTEAEINHAQSKFSKLVASCIALIIIGVAVFITLQANNLFSNDSTIPITILMLFIAIGAPMLVYAGIQEEKYNIAEYNSRNSQTTKADQNKLSKICFVIMITATIIYLILGFILELWRLNWIIFPIGGMLCGIASIIIKHE